MSNFRPQDLVGLTVLEDWVIEQVINLKENNSTGGFFCIPYIVRNKKTGERAFLKILDVVKAIQNYDSRGIGVLETLRRITADHHFERELLEACKSRNLKKIVQALGSGEIPIEIPPLGKIGFPFLIMELAEGDTHKYLNSDALDHAWWFSTLHQAAIGIHQLHSIDVSHQDVKLSNVVFFGIENAKLADLGRAARKGTQSRNDDRVGDMTYIPPEYFYGFQATDWGERFLAIDLYLLGNLAFTGYSKMSMTWAIFSKIPREFSYDQFSGNYSEVLPVLIRAFAEVIVETRAIVPEIIRDNFINTIEQLCHPDPSKRGHPKNHQAVHGNKYSLERYVSAFNQMSMVFRKGIIP